MFATWVGHVAAYIIVVVTVLFIGPSWRGRVSCRGELVVYWFVFVVTDVLALREEIAR